MVVRSDGFRSGGFIAQQPQMIICIPLRSSSYLDSTRPKVQGIMNLASEAIPICLFEFITRLLLSEVTAPPPPLSGPLTTIGDHRHWPVGMMGMSLLGISNGRLSITGKKH